MRSPKKKRQRRKSEDREHSSEWRVNNSFASTEVRTEPNGALSLLGEPVGQHLTERRKRGGMLETKIGVFPEENLSKKKISLPHTSTHTHMQAHTHTLTYTQTHTYTHNPQTQWIRLVQS